MIDAVSK